LQASGVKTEELVQGFEGYPLTLAWGEVVPLYFSMKEETKLTILGVPRSRHEGIFDIQSELKKISNLLISLIRSKTERICLIFSGDLSHTHDPDGPYGYHDTSKPFDLLIQEWAREPNRETFEEFLELQPTALACGMAGMSILQGIFDNYQSTTQSVHYSLPTYFGMMTAHWSIELN
ncbi:MAG: hypothetical protein IH840_01070, partial [Candidatus Heimdallarchaeota archaeon]|nr:hypothetical protein [Candidatus Heimdallarchaeota archaeon]